MLAITLVAGWALLACSSKPTDVPAAECEHVTPAPPEGDPPGLLWNYHREVGEGPEYTTISLGLDTRYALAGSFAGFTLFEVRDGAQVWQFFDVDGDYLALAAAQADVFYGMVADADVATLHRFGSASNEPLWSFDAKAAGFTFAFPPSTYWNQFPMAVTPDGRVLAVAAAQEDHVALLFFGPDSAEPRIHLTDIPSLKLPELSLQLTPDGRTCFFLGSNEPDRKSNRIYRLDVASLEVEHSFLVAGAQRATNSLDGSVLVLPNYNLLRAYRWTGETYELSLDYSPYVKGVPGLGSASAVAILPDNDTLFVAWDHQSQHQISLMSFSLECGDTPLWTYTTPEGTGRFTELAADLKVSPDGAWIALGSWGSEDNSHPEFTLLHASDPMKPAFVLDTPGSVNALDMALDGSLIVGGTKAVHANIISNGGGVFAVATGAGERP
jgi:hypothetical protein